MPALGEAIDALVALRGERPRSPGRVWLRREGPVAELVLDNPQARHALTLGMMEDLGRAVEALRRWPGAAVLVRAATPDAFCAGGHLGEVRAFLGGPAEGRVMAEAMGQVLDGLLALPQVTVAAVEGPAVGGGAELLTAVDHRVFGPGAWLRFKQAALGVGAGWGGARRLLLHVPRRTALRWLTTAERVDARAALDAGFADRVAEGDVVEAARALLAPVVRLPAVGVRACKRQVVAAAALGDDRSADVAAFAEVWGGEEHLARLHGPGARERDR